MSRMSDYPDYKTGKTTEEKKAFLDSAKVPVSGKYTQNGKFETKNVPVEELGGSSLPDTTGHNEGDVLTIGQNGPDWIAPSGSGGYTPVEMNPEHVTSEDNLDINLTNHSLVTLDLSGLAESIEYVNLIAPEVNSGDYLDIIVQIKPNSEDIQPIVYKGNKSTRMPMMLDTGATWFSNEWLHIHIIGNLWLRCVKEISSDE